MSLFDPKEVARLGCMGQRSAEGGGRMTNVNKEQINRLPSAPCLVQTQIRSLTIVDETRSAAATAAGSVHPASV
jgi:hypothetical protein